jgi:hypothetical protein
MSDIIKPGPLAGGAKSNGFLDKIAKFTIGNSRGGLPSNGALIWHVKEKNGTKLTE